MLGRHGRQIRNCLDFSKVGSCVMRGRPNALMCRMVEDRTGVGRSKGAVVLLGREEAHTHSS